MENEGQKPLPPDVADDEPLARHLFSSSHFAAQAMRVKWPAFMPPKGQRAVSVMRHKNCSKSCILKIGKGIEAQRGVSLKAVASLQARAARAIDDLKVKADTKGRQHRRHANIIFGAYDEAKMRQSAQSAAQDIALKAKLIHHE